VRAGRSISSLEIGEPVYAIGNPRGLERTISEGLSDLTRLLGRRIVRLAREPRGYHRTDARDSQQINFAIPAEDYWK
jgi:S1-C subfamily serine protease